MTAKISSFVNNITSFIQRFGSVFHGCFCNDFSDIKLNTNKSNRSSTSASQSVTVNSSKHYSHGVQKPYIVKKDQIALLSDLSNEIFKQIESIQSPEKSIFAVETPTARKIQKSEIECITEYINNNKTTIKNNPDGTVLHKNTSKHEDLRNEKLNHSVTIFYNKTSQQFEIFIHDNIKNNDKDIKKGGSKSVKFGIEIVLSCQDNILKITSVKDMVLTSRDGNNKIHTKRGFFGWDELHRAKQCKIDKQVGKMFVQECHGKKTLANATESLTDKQKCDISQELIRLIKLAYRDVKPENIVINAEGGIAIIDTNGAEITHGFDIVNVPKERAVILDSIQLIPNTCTDSTIIEKLLKQFYQENQTIDDKESLVVLLDCTKIAEDCNYTSIVNADPELQAKQSRLERIFLMLQLYKPEMLKTEIKSRTIVDNDALYLYFHQSNEELLIKLYSSVLKGDFDIQLDNNTTDADYLIARDGINKQEELFKHQLLVAVKSLYGENPAISYPIDIPSDTKHKISNNNIEVLTLELDIALGSNNPIESSLTKTLSTNNNSLDGYNCNIPISV